MSERLILQGGRVVDPIAGTDEVRDVVIVDGRVADAGDTGTGGAEVIDCSGPDRGARPGGHAHAPPRAGLRAQGDHRDGDAIGGDRRLHRGRAHGQHGTRRRPRRGDPRGPRPGGGGRPLRRLPGGRHHEGARGRVARRDRRHGGGRRPDVQRRRQVRALGTAAPQRARLREGVRRRGDRRSLRGRVARRERPDARGLPFVLARAPRPARGGGGGHRGPRRGDGSHDGHAAPHLPSVVRPLGGARPSREGRGHPGDRGGHAAPSGVHRRRPRHVRHQPEGEPTVAERGGSRRPARRARRRDDRRDRHGSRTARGRGEGGGVRSVAARNDRARDRARGGAHRAGRTRRPDARPRARGPVRSAGADPGSLGARRSHRTGPPREPGRVRPQRPSGWSRRRSRRRAATPRSWARRCTAGSSTPCSGERSP